MYIYIYIYIYIVYYYIFVLNWRFLFGKYMMMDDHSYLGATNVPI